MTENTETAPAPGTDAELSLILNGVYACTRVWEAWGYGTMTEDDFEEPSDPGVRGDLIAWRDAAVQAEREYWQERMKLPVTSLCECGGLASHEQHCRWRQGYGSHVISPEGGRQS